MWRAIVRSASSCGVILAAFVSLAACASPITVGADYDTKAEFSGWRTWSPAMPAQGAQDSLVDRRIDAAVAKVMAERGFTQVAADSADFLVGHQTRVQQKTDVVTSGYDPYWGSIGSYRSGSWGGGGMTQVIQYDVGTLFVDFLDRKGGFVAWRGHASSTLDDSLEPAERDARIEEAIRKTLAQFPPKPK